MYSIFKNCLFFQETCRRNAIWNKLKIMKGEMVGTDHIRHHFIIWKIPWDVQVLLKRHSLTLSNALNNLEHKMKNGIQFLSRHFFRCSWNKSENETHILDMILFLAVKKKRNFFFPSKDCPNNSLCSSVKTKTIVFQSKKRLCTKKKTEL